jgi:hypothetical protein
VLADSLARYLTILGIKRVSKEISLNDYLSEKYGEQNGSKGKSNVHVYKTAPESPTTLPVEEQDSDA